MKKHPLHGKVINNVKRPPKEVIERFAKHDTCKIGDAMGRYGVMHYEIKPIIRGMKVAGPAVTVLTKPGDALYVQKVIDFVQPGDVVVVDSGGLKEMACVGERLLGYMQDRGMAGFVVDGAIRDSKGVIELGIPVFARGICIRVGSGTGPGAINVPIQCGGVPVNPGDIIVGDDDGVIVVPQENALDIANASDEGLEGELLRVEKVASGETIDEVYNISSRTKIWEE